MSEIFPISVVKTLMPARTSQEELKQTSDLLSTILNEEEPEFRLNFRDNLIGFNSVMKDGKYKFDDYINAVKFASHRLTGMTLKDAYIKTFPDRYARLQAEGKKDISSYVSAYAKNKLVLAVLQQAIVPSYILNQDYFQSAINVQVKLMMDEDISPLVRQKAADSLMTHLKPPEVAKTELDIKISASDELSQLYELTSMLAKQQHEKIINGEVTTVDIAAVKLLESDNDY